MDDPRLATITPELARYWDPAKIEIPPDPIAIETVRSGPATPPKARKPKPAPKQLPPAPTQKLKNRVLRARARRAAIMERSLVKSLVLALNQYFQRRKP